MNKLTEQQQMIAFIRSKPSRHFDLEKWLERNSSQFKPSQTWVDSKAVADQDAAENSSPKPNDSTQ